MPASFFHAGDRGIDMTVLLLRSLAVFVAATSGPAAGAAMLFEGSEILDLTLSGPLATVIDDRADRDEIPFALSVDGKEVEVMVRVRGRSRVELCRFPPLRLRFPPGAAEDTVLAGLDKVKMVTHCDSRDAAAEDSVLNEYAAYRLFNIASDSSYRTRLLRVTYVDTDGKLRRLRGRTYFAFVIEPKANLAERLGALPVEVPGLVFSKLDSRQTALTSVFQYAIGNSDWSFVASAGNDSCCHNIDLVESGGRLLPIPYDFDQAGFVAAEYSRQFATNQTAGRRWGGYCRSSMDSISAALDELVDLEMPMLDLVRGIPSRKRNTAAHRLRYLGAFFEAAADRESLLRRFEKSCVGSN